LAVTTGFSVLAFALLAGAAWLIPPEVVQNWAFDPSSTDAFAQFEAVGIAEAAQWLAQWAAPVLALVSYLIWRHHARLSLGIEGAVRRFWRVTANPPSLPDSLRFRLVPIVKRVAIGSALALAIGHWGSAFQQRLKDWPYYRFNDGDQVLPNISDANREVIRYLQASTPENARIFVVSDQKLFFLSYYLRPRSLFHRMHPTAEHLIPRANQARQLAAYRLSELPPDVWECRPDFVLEYFEGPEYIDPARATEDRAWLQFARQRTGDSTRVPEYVVVLRRWPITGGSP